MAHSFLVHAPDDVVGVTVQDIEPGPAVPGKIQSNGSEFTLASGEQVIKYGIAIGRATRDIRAGEHVHVHNVKGERWA